MSGELKREQGETFASFTQRQKALQVRQSIEKAAAIKNIKRKVKARKQTIREVSDFDYSMNS